MLNLKRRLHDKDWKKSDINKTVKILDKAKKHPKIKILDKSVYWFSLLLAIIINFIISLSLIPILLALKNFQLYLVVITIGISFRYPVTIHFEPGLVLLSLIGETKSFLKKMFNLLGCSPPSSSSGDSSRTIF